MQDSRVQHAYRDASLGLGDSLPARCPVCYSAVPTVPNLPQARGLKTSSVLTIPPNAGAIPDLPFGVQKGPSKGFSVLGLWSPFSHVRAYSGP